MIRNLVFHDFFGARNIAALFFAWVSSALRASLGEDVFLFFNLQLLRLICLLANPAFS